MTAPMTRWYHTVAARPVLANVVPHSSSTPCTCQCCEVVLCVQTVQTFEAALEALVAAGVELVEFDMGLLTAEGAEIEAELLLAYEMPREVSRSVHLLHCRFKLGPF